MSVKMSIASLGIFEPNERGFDTIANTKCITMFKNSSTIFIIVIMGVIATVIGMDVTITLTTQNNDNYW